MGLNAQSGMTQMQPAQGGEGTLSRYRAPGFGSGQNQMQGIMQMLAMAQQMRGTGQGKMGGRTQQAQPATNPAFGQQMMPMPAQQQMPQPSLFQPVQQPAPRVFPPPAAPPVAPEISPEAQRQEEQLRQTDPYYARIRDAGLDNTSAYQHAFGFG